MRLGSTVTTNVGSKKQKKREVRERAREERQREEDERGNERGNGRAIHVRIHEHDEQVSEGDRPQEANRENARLHEGEERVNRQLVDDLDRTAEGVEDRRAAVRLLIPE